MIPFDFETAGIESRPNYPPTPVGVAIATDAGHDRYFSWGHPTANNCAAADGFEMLQDVWFGELLCHNAAFDLAVAIEKLGLPLPNGAQINDTMIMAFLLEPYGELSLKPLATRYLGMPPAEQDAVRDWLKANYKMPTGRAPTDKQCGALICEAPGVIVSPYACGDTERTARLFKHFVPLLKERGLWEAYRRECEIMPMLLDNSARGIPLDHKALRADTKHYEQVLAGVEANLRGLWKREIDTIAPSNFDSGDELSEALSMNPRIKLPRTPTGKLSTAKEALTSALPDGKVKGLLLYRSALVQCLQMYMRPWLEHGTALHCNWNQVRNYEDYGAKTGRLSSSPNMQNTTNPDKYDELLAYMRSVGLTSKSYTLPSMRTYLVAPKGFVLFSRDYSQQELKFLAHYEAAELDCYFTLRDIIERYEATDYRQQMKLYEFSRGQGNFNARRPLSPQEYAKKLSTKSDGALAKAYIKDPSTDLHVFTQHLIKQHTGLELSRKACKTISFAKLYGAGRPRIAAQLGVDYDTACKMVNAYEIALPGVLRLQETLKEHGRAGHHITTIGGRQYFAPAARIEKDTGSVRTFEYVLLNYLIQGSSADQTKEAMRLWWPQIRGTDTRFLLTVHDQLVGCAPKGEEKAASALLDVAMCHAFKLDVPLKTDPTYGANFGSMKKPS